VPLEPEDALARLAIFGLTESDQTNLSIIRNVLREQSKTVVDRFYDHLLAFPECQKILASETRVLRLKEAQRAYLSTLGEFQVKDASSVARYFEGRFRVGVAHERVGLTPRLYAGAYAKLGQLATEAVAERHSGRIDLIASLHKILILDSHLALEAYQTVREDAMVATASRDFLTEVANRPAALEGLKREVERAIRFRRSMALLFIDVDHFKRINDSLGHAAGDSLLRQVAQALQAAVRPADIVGRYGGDEFLVGLVETELDAAIAVAERVRARLAGGASPITLSVGVVMANQDDTVQTLVDRADRAMYEAKKEGRDRVSVLPGPSEARGSE
jgi:two-component system, cell cycle response regulator